MKNQKLCKVIRKKLWFIFRKTDHDGNVKIKLGLLPSLLKRDADDINQSLLASGQPHPDINITDLVQYGISGAEGILIICIIIALSIKATCCRSQRERLDNLFLDRIQG